MIKGNSWGLSARRSLRSLLLCTGVGAAIGAVSTPVSAQERASAQELEEIIVTARKREERLQDVPSAITAITGDTLQATGVQRLDEVTSTVPNMQLNHSGTGPSVATVYIRGIGYNGTEKLDSPSVGVFIDGFYWGMGHGQLIDTFDISSLEILRGPQSVLFGRNTSGGAINVYRTRPFGDQQATVKLGVGDYDAKSMQAVYHTGTWNNFAAKVGFTYRERDGFFNNLYDGTDDGRVKYQAVHAMFSWTPTDTFSALLIGDKINEHGEATALQNENVLGGRLFLLPRLGRTSLNPGVGTYDVTPDLKSRQKLNADRVSLQLDWETGLGKLTTITGYLNEKDYTLQDFDAGCGGDSQRLGCGFNTNPLLVSPTNPTGTLHTIRDQDFEEFTQEVRLAGDLSDRLAYIVGAFYYKDSIGSRQTTNFAAFERTGQRTESKAVFGQLGWQILPDLSLTGGAQWISDEKRFRKTVFLLGSGLVLLPQLEQKNKWDDVVYQWSLDWKWGPDRLLYASMSDGFRSGGFSARGTAAEQFDPTAPNFTGGASNFLSFDPETTRQFEAGSKNVFFGGDLVANLTLFHTTLKGQQVGEVLLTPRLPVNTNTVVNNLQETVFKGAEIEVTARVPAIEGLQVRLNYGYLKSKIEKAEVPATRLAVGPGGVAGTAAQGIIDLRGRPLLRAPEFTYSVALQYDRPIADGRLLTNVLYRYTDDFVLASIGNFPDTEKGYGVLDASVGYEWKNLLARVSVKNLLEEEYRYMSLPNVLFQGWGDPRTVTFELTMKFGAP